MYFINTPDMSSPNGIRRSASEPLAGYLESAFPEIVNAAKS
jgi:hypothetical protein